MRLVFLAAWCLPIMAFAEGGLPDQPYIYVEGKAKIERAPDVVVLDFKLGAHDHDQTVANQQIQAKAAKVFAMLDAEKIAEKDVVAQSLESQREYDEGDDDTPKSKRRKLIGYTVTRPFAVKVRDVGAFPKIVDQLLTIGVEEFSSISAELSSESELSAQVRDQAIANAREQAEQTLKAEKLKIVSTFAISPVTFTQVKDSFFQTANQEGTVYPFYSASARKLDPTQYRLSPVTVSQSIHVIYLIGPQ